METGAIFVGFMPEPTRLAVADVIDHLNPSRVVIPCVGAFATAYTIALNTKVRQIETSDMTVYSSILGYLYSGQDLEALRIKVKHKAWDGVDGLTPTEAAARYLLFLKVAQLNQRSYYHRSIADHLLLRREVLESKLTSSLSQVCQILKGRVSYEVLDMGDHMGRVDADPDVVVELDPPIYKKGYTKMFNVGHMIEWDEPDIVEFDPADLTPLMEKKLGSKATYLLTTYRNAERVPSGWRPIHAHIAKKDWVNYLWVNRFVPLSVLKRRGLTTRKVALEPWGLRDKLHKKQRKAQGHEES